MLLALALWIAAGPAVDLHATGDPGSDGRRPAAAAPSGPDLVVPDPDGGPIGAGDGRELSTVPEARGVERLADAVLRVPAAAPEPELGAPRLFGGAAAPALSSATPDGTELRRRVRGLLQDADASLGRQDWRAAESKAAEAAALDPDSPEPHLFRSKALLHLGQFDAGEREAATAQRLDPKSAGAAKALAFARLKLGRLAEAREAGQQAAALNAGDAEAFAVLAQIEDGLGHRQRALEMLETAAHLDERFYEKYKDAMEGGRIRSEGGLGLDQAFGLASWLRRALGDTWSALFALSLALALGAAAWVVLRSPAPRAAPAREHDRAVPGPGALLAGKYETMRVIGRGGMGDVLEARDQSLGRSVAIKRMSTRLIDGDARVRQLMIQEARTVAALRHPAIVDVYEIIEDAEGLYLVFELIRGKTVQQILAESKRLSPARTLDVLRPVCQALEFAHSRGVVHRDLKPSNIMVTEQGYPKLMDFGIARRIADGVTAPAAPASSSGPFDYARTRTIVGTPLYMAPEMEEGIVCRESDVYSLAICAYEMLTGDRPFDEPATVMRKIQMEFTPPSRRAPELPPAVDDAIAAALQPSPEKRTHGAQAFLERLEAACRA